MGLCDASMRMHRPVPISGHVLRRDGARGPVWHAKYRFPDGRQVQRKIGPAWRERGRPAAGFFTKRTVEAWLADVLAEARRGELPGMVHTGATFTDAAAEFMRWLECDRQRKPSTLRDDRSILRAHLLPEFGRERLEDITTDPRSEPTSARDREGDRADRCPCDGVHRQRDEPVVRFGRFDISGITRADCGWPRD